MQLIPNAFTFPSCLCQTVLCDHGNTEQAWDEKMYLQVPFFLQEHSVCIDLILLTLCLVAQNQMSSKNLGILFQSPYLIKKRLYIIEKDRTGTQ